VQESWQAARRELAFYAQETRKTEAPARVEMRLRQKFRIQNRALSPRKVAAVAVWALAAAAVVVAMVSWRDWRKDSGSIAQQNIPQPGAGARPGVRENAGAKMEQDQRPVAGEVEGANALIADNELSGFTLLPGAAPSEGEDASILRVRLQRGSLSAYGLPVNEERAGEWIQVDLLVGDDGVPQAVRLPN
jgi:hypothetical protein